MPFLALREVEFALISFNGKETDLATAGRFKIVAEDGSKESYQMFVKPCGEKNWKEARAEDVEFLKKVMEKYST